MQVCYVYQLNNAYVKSQKLELQCRNNFGT